MTVTTDQSPQATDMYKTPPHQHAQHTLGVVRSRIGPLLCRSWTYIETCFCRKAPWASSYHYYSSRSYTLSRAFTLSKEPFIARTFVLVWSNPSPCHAKRSLPRHIWSRWFMLREVGAHPSLHGSNCPTLLFWGSGSCASMSMHPQWPPIPWVHETDLWVVLPASLALPNPSRSWPLLEVVAHLAPLSPSHWSAVVFLFTV